MSDNNIAPMVVSSCQPNNRTKHIHTQSFDVLLFEMLFILWATLILKDWVWSEAEPFPYLAALRTLLGVMLSMALALNFAPILRVIRKTLGVQSHTTLPRKVRIVLGAVILVLVTGILAEIIHGFSPLPALNSKDEGLLGTGFGSGVHPQESWGAVLVTEQGWIAAIVLFSLIAVCLWFGSQTALQAVRRTNFPRDIFALASTLVALCAICGVFLTPIGRLPFLTPDSVAGTWILALSLAWIGGVQSLAVPQAQQQRTRLSSWRSLQLRWLTGAFMLLCVGIVVHLMLGSVVCRYVGTGTPKRFHEFTPLAEVSPIMQDATIAMEDHAFYRHHGFDWTAMHHALRMDVRDGRIEEGGSTITQQLAKNLFLTNDRTLWRKVQEAALTWELERMLPKSRILELYLNAIDYGIGQRGISAAAHYYFHNTPEKLTLAESALLVGLVPAPPHVQEEMQPEKLVQGQQTALSRMSFFFPRRYPLDKTSQAGQVPLERVMYPYKDALDRGATSEIPATWHGVSFYFYADPDEASAIDHVSRFLKPALAAFLTEARRRYNLTGIDHLGVYNDRPMRQSQTALSAHAYGQAIDISGFRFAGNDIQVTNHSDPHVLAQLKLIEALLKKHFPVVVDWRDDPLRHQTHFHCEVQGPRPLSSSLIPTSVTIAISESFQKTSHGPYQLQPEQRYEVWRSGVLVRQTTPESCGPASLATVLTYYLGRPTSNDEMMDLSETRGSGSGAENLEKASEATGFRAIPASMTLAQVDHHLQIKGAPLIVLWKHPAGHWVVVVGRRNGDLLVSNPNHGNDRMTESEFCRLWGGKSGEVLSIMAAD